MSGTGFSLSLKKPKKQNKKRKSALSENETGVSSSQTVSSVVPKTKKQQRTALGDAFDTRPKKRQTSVLLINEIDSATDYLHEKTKEQDKDQLCIQPAEVLINKDQEETTLDEYQHVPVGQFGMALLRGMGYEEEDTSNEEAQTNEKSTLSGPALNMASSKKVSSTPFSISNEVFLPVVQKSKSPKTD
ncbi:hypothetical protein ACO0QE_004613 [Hanseniaspora vineae]